MRQRALFAILVLLASGPGAPVSADTPASPAAMQTATASPPPISTDDCATAQLSDIMAAYTPASSAGAKATPTPPPIPSNASSYLEGVLATRLMRCSEMLGGHHPHAKAPSPGDACWPSDSEKNDVWQLWAHLKFCESLVHPPQKPPTGIAWQIPLASSSGYQPVIFVVGLGGDPAMAAKLVSTLAVYLNDGKGETGYHFKNNAVLIPEPGWSTDEFAKQCEGSPAVQGAIIVDITATGKGASDEFIRRRNWTAIEATALYATCDNQTPSYVWLSDIVKVESHQITVTPLTPLAALLMLGAAYEVFAPARTTSTGSTNTFPNPSPIPSAGRVTQVVTTNSTTLNASTLTGVATGFFSSSISYTNGVAPLTQEPSVDQLTWNALQSVAFELIKDMNCWQPAPGSTGPQAQDVIGRPRTLPGYNPPAGLGAYNTVAPSAPFCEEPGSSESINDLLRGTPPPMPTPSPTPRS